MKKLNNKGINNPNYIDGRTLKINYCIDCLNKGIKRKISYNAKRCKQCNDKFHSKQIKGTCIGIEHHHFKGGLPHCKICNKKLSNYTYKYCKSCCQLGNNNCMKSLKTRAKASVSHKKYKPTIETKLKLSKRMSGKGNPMFGKITHSKGSYYKSIWMRSTWEIKYAKYLDKNKIKWQYEQQTFDLGDSTYTPDFYLPKTDEYIEIKGWWRDDAKKKFRLFKKLYPNINIKILNRKFLKKEKII
jgi:hypothetical protein